MGKGKGRDWGYASYDEEGNLIYTSYENSGAVNRYRDNGDGGHSHEHWDNADDYNNGEDPDTSRLESNSTKNPSTGEIQNNGGCYLTTACIKHMGNNFDDNCYELSVLRWFRDNFVSKEDIEHYYKTAPIIVESINKDNKANQVYNYIYDTVVSYCIDRIKNGDYQGAYDRYKNNILVLEEVFAKKNLQEKLVKTLTLVPNKKKK